MSRALRYTPPLGDRGLIVRPRLLARLRTRFDRRLTAVVAPAGFGKTTLLAQAVQENTLSPLGEDRWLTCQRDDTALSFLAAGAFAAVGVSAPVPEDPGDAALTVAEAIWSAAPCHVALFLDDAHLVEAASPGGRFLTGLVEELPRNGYVVISSRPPLPLRASRLVANGDAVVVGERELHFRDDEMAAFAASRHVPGELLEDVGGWPALAELTATAGAHAVSGYVWEELLSRLSPERRHALAVLVAVGGADDDLGAALLGEGVRLEKLLHGLPLVVRGPSGWWSLHGLWSAILSSSLDAGQVAAARRTAGLVLAGRRRYHDAMNLLADAAAWDDVRALVIEVCEVGTPLVPPDVLESWLRRLPPEARETPEGLLLAAMIAEPASPDTAEELLERAFALAPEVAPVRFACLNALVEVAFRRTDRQQMTLFLQRLTDLAASGHKRAAGWIALFRGLLARTPAEVRAELAAPALVSEAALSPVQEWLRAHLLMLKLGDPAAAEPGRPPGRGARGPNLAVLFRSQLVGSLPPPARTPRRGPGRAPRTDRRATSGEGVHLTGGRHLCRRAARDPGPGRAGRRTPADLPERHRRLVGRLGADRRGPGGVGPPGLRRPGKGGRGTGCVRCCTCPWSATPPCCRCRPRRCPCCTSCCPRCDPSGTPSRSPAASPWSCGSSTLVGARERGSLLEVSELPTEARALMRAVLPAPWTAELALGMVASGREEARVLVEELGSRARPVGGAWSIVGWEMPSTYPKWSTRAGSSPASSRSTSVSPGALPARRSRVARSSACGVEANSESSRWNPGSVNTGRQHDGSLGPMSPTTSARAAAPWRNSSGNVVSDSSGTPRARRPAGVRERFRQESGFCVHGTAVVTCGRPEVPSRSEARSARARGAESTRRTRWRAVGMVYPRTTRPWTSERSSTGQSPPAAAVSRPRRRGCRAPSGRGRRCRTAAGTSGR
ncbi:MAG: hypothetical protein M3P89_05935, partial [Actinomycetota bacterium]|nr:hypothetical protein [Actinomycetota bacterium]